jgi:hypothetical protein
MLLVCALPMLPCWFLLRRPAAGGASGAEAEMLILEFGDEGMGSRGAPLLSSSAEDTASQRTLPPADDTQHPPRGTA